jgi:hypothetical protein
MDQCKPDATAVFVPNSTAIGPHSAASAPLRFSCAVTCAKSVRYVRDSVRLSAAKKILLSVMLPRIAHNTAGK